MEADGALRRCPWAIHSSGLSLSFSRSCNWWRGGLIPREWGTADYFRTMVTVQISESPKFCLCILPCLVSEIKNRIEKDK